MLIGQNLYMKYFSIILLFFFLLGDKKIRPITLKFYSVTGIGKEQAICRRDPSDVIKIGNLYFVFYTKLKRGSKVYPEGYFGTVWYAVSSDEGFNWIEKKEIIRKGEKGKFDSTGVFTPNVIVDKNQKIYVYYTGVGDNFDNYNDYSTKNRTAIGVAEVEFNENGDLIKSKKINNGEPILLPSKEQSGKFDSFRVDDSSLLFRSNKYWLYYKGRGYKLPPSKTKMSVAVSDTPYGPFKKLNNGNPIQKEGHEVLIWPYKKGVVSLVSHVGRGLYYSSNGEKMNKITSRLRGRLRAPGLYRPDLTQNGKSSKNKKEWGIAMATYDNDPFLNRYEVTLPNCLDKKIESLND